MYYKLLYAIILTLLQINDFKMSRFKTEMNASCDYFNVLVLERR